MNITLDTLTAGGQFEVLAAPVVDAGYGPVEFIVTDVKGWWGSPAPRTRRTDRPTGPGAYRAAGFRGTRSVALSVVATSVALDPTVMRQTERQLAALCNDPSRLYPLTVADQLGATTAYVELDGEILLSPRDAMAWSTTMSIPLCAPDPRRFATSWLSTTTPVGVAGSGGVVSTGAGIDATGAGIGAGTAPVPTIAAAAGAGTDANGLVFALTGPVTGAASITDVVSGAQLAYTGRLGATDVVFINADRLPAYDVPGAPGPLPARGVVLNNGATARSALAVFGGWPSLAPGQVGTYLLSGNLGAGAALTVFSRGAWT